MKSKYYDNISKALDKDGFLCNAVAFGTFMTHENASFEAAIKEFTLSEDDMMLDAIKIQEFNQTNQPEIYIEIERLLELSNSQVFQIEAALEYSSELGNNTASRNLRRFLVEKYFNQK